MGYMFFLSYAREDKKSDGLVRKFYEYLCKDIASKRIAVSPHEVGFFDGAETEFATRWDEKLASALQQSRVFIALYSPYYFQNNFCGKEWTIFSSRVDAYAKCLPPGSEFPALMFPVLWLSENYILPLIPTTLSRIQYKHDSYGREYAENGLRVMMRNKKFRHQYDDFVNIFANKVIDAAEKHSLPALNDLPSLKEVTPAFPDVTSFIKPTSDTHNSTLVQLTDIGPSP